MKPVVCLGGLTMDEIYHVPAFPEIDDAQIITHSTDSYGGRGALVALTLGMLDIPVSLFTAVGNDFEEKGYEDFLKKNKVNLDGIIKCENDACFNTKVFVADRKDPISFFKMSFLAFEKPKQTHYKLIDNAETLYFAINDLDFNLECLRYVAGKDKTIIHNLSSEIIFNPKYLPHAMANSDILILNEVEYNNLCNVKEVNSAIIFKKHSRLKHLIVTKGKNGSILYSRNETTIKERKIKSITAERAGVPLGLGDAYSAGIVYGISQHWNLEKAANFGAYLGAASYESEYSFIEKKVLEKYKKQFNKEFD